MKRYKKCIFGLVFPVTFFLMVSGCGKQNLCEKQELLRKSSPDNVVDVVMVRMDCGATTDYSYQVYLTPHGGEVSEYPIFIADKVSNIDISWKAEKSLQISYDRARIFKFKNFWQTKEIDDFQYIVSIIEVKN